MHHQQFMESQRLALFADVTILRALCDQTAVDSLRDLIHQQTRRQDRVFHGFRNGYRWLAGAALYSLLEKLIVSPEALGIASDQRAWNWWRYNRFQGGSTLPSAFADPASPLAGIAGRLYSILMLIRISGDSWDRMEEAFGKALSVSDVLHTRALDCPVSNFQNGYSTPTVEWALQMRAAENLSDYLHGDTFGAAYRFVWGEDAEANPEGVDTDLLGYNVLGQIETELSPLPMMASNSSIPSQWGIGVIAGLCIVMQQFGLHDEPKPSLEETFLGFSNGDQKIIDVIDDFVKGPFAKLERQYPSQHFGLKVGPVLSPYELSELQGPVSRVSEAEKLASLLGIENKLVASAGPLDHEQFETIVSGLASLNRDGCPIQIVRISHTKTDYSLNWFSLAVRVPKFGLNSNASMWWVFYKIYALGTLEPDCAIPLTRVEAVLTKFNNQVEVEEIQGIRPADLLALCESPAWKYLREYSKRIQDVNSDLRGAIPEMLAALMLARRGYQNIRTEFKPQILGGQEIDAIGILSSGEGNSCVVVETKGQAETDEDLEDEIREFSSKVERLRQQLPELPREVGFEGTIDTVSGRFVSMADLRHYERESFDIELWDYRRFIQELQSSGISPHYIRLLEMTKLTLVMEDLWEYPGLSLYEGKLPDGDN